MLAKREALHGVISTIERVYGKGSIQTLGQSTGMNIETTSTGALTLDMALGRCRINCPLYIL
ncbi:hypothetical protein EON64_08100 [archaeon]|nr:MAG: hypothetical protein EON64_08100 [archaeon]